MTRSIIRSFATVICGSALLAGFCSVASAVDPRFELEIKELSRKMGPINQQKRPLRLKTTPRKRATTPRPVMASIPRSSTNLDPYPDSLLTLIKLAPSSGEMAMTTLHALWDRLIPAPHPDALLELQSDNFMLTLDPNVYQLLPAADGGKVIIDATRSLPPLIKNLIQEKDPLLRIVSETPAAGKPFFSQLLRAAGFYSVEPEFTLEFGDDPRLSVRAEYRIERTAESLLHNETVLLYTSEGRYALPLSLKKFLSGAGFQVIEPDLPPHDTAPRRDRVIQARAGERFQVADLLLDALGLETEAGKGIEFTGWKHRGINLMVQVDRSFTYNGKPFALAAYDGDPINYTLTRLLESQGVTVVILSRKDDFHAVIEKLLAALKLPASFDRHSLWPMRETPYTVQVSGYLVRDSSAERNILLTDREISPLLLDLMKQNGYDSTW